MKYYNIFQGKFVTRVPDSYQGQDVVERTNELGKKVRELQYDALDNIVLVDIKETMHEEYGLSYDFYFIDENQYIQIRFSQGPLASQILKTIENVFIDQPLSIELYYFPEEKRSTLNLFQKGQKLARLYTKENPGSLPPPVEREYNGKMGWDWTDQIKYWRYLIKSLSEKLPGVKSEMASAAQEQSKPAPANVDTGIGEVLEEPAYPKEGLPPNRPGLGEPEDDLPF